MFDYQCSLTTRDHPHNIHVGHYLKSYPELKYANNYLLICYLVVTYTGEIIEELGGITLPPQTSSVTHQKLRTFQTNW